MHTLELNMLFWTDNIQNSTRLRNVKYTSKELKKLSEYLNQRGIQTVSNLYDYSPTQIIPESIHIAYPSTVYKRSEKINNLISKCNSTLFAVIDSDCFLDPSSYKILADTILSTEDSFCITFDVLDFSEEDTQKVVEGEDPCKFNYSSRFPGRAGGLGAFFIINTLSIIDIGMFNLKFNTWGGEDGEVYDRIDRSSSIRKLPLNKEVARLFHLSHFSDRGNINYFDNDEYVRNNY